MGVMQKARRAAEGMSAKSARLCARTRTALYRFGHDTSGQGTTEYAILVGVLVVIACLAIAVFKPKIQELWDAISSGINGL